MARLRKLAPDAALFRRRAAGEPLRELAPDDRVVHTTLGRYFARPEAVRELKRAARLNRAERRAAEARERAAAQAEREAGAHAERRPPPGGRTQADAAGAAVAPAQAVAARRPPSRDGGEDTGGGGRRRGRSSAYADWLDERDTAAAPRPISVSGS